MVYTQDSYHKDENMIVPASDCSNHLDSRSYSTYLEQYYSLVTKRNGDVNNHIAEQHLQTKHQIDWDCAICITYSTHYCQCLTLEIWFTNLEQTPLNRSEQLPAPYKRLDLLTESTKTKYERTTGQLTI